MVRSLVFASFPEDALVPHDVVLNDYAAWGARLSWTAPIYILGANFAEQMPHDEDWMPINGNPHPLPGVPFPDLPQFILPNYPALGWNEVPPPPPEQPDMGDNNWGNAVWGEDEQVQNDVQVEQESMVLDNSEDHSLSVEQHIQPNFVLIDDVDQPVEPAVGLEQPVVENNIAPVYNPEDWALVVYQPPAHHPETSLEESAELEMVMAVPLPATVVTAAKVMFGPELPPEMIFRRNFEAILHSDFCYEIPKPIQVLPLQSDLLSKRSCDLAFEVPRLTYDNTNMEHRPVARALFLAQQIESSPIDEAEQFSEPPEQAGVEQRKVRRARKTMAPTPVVETSVRRCTRGSLQRDGYKPTFQELPMQAKRRKPKAKPFSATVSQNMQDEPIEDLPPPTPIPKLQQIGQELGIADDLISVEKLMADPSTPTNNGANV